LFEDPGAFKPIETLRQFHRVAMFHDHQSTGCYQMRSVEKIENADIFISAFVWWIEKNEIGRQAARRQVFKPPPGVCYDHLRTGANPKGFKVLSNESRSR